jgi:hypothetical protein
VAVLAMQRLSLRSLSHRLFLKSRGIEEIRRAVRDEFDFEIGLFATIAAFLS